MPQSISAVAGTQVARVRQRWRNLPARRPSPRTTSRPRSRSVRPPRVAKLQVAQIGAQIEAKTSEMMRHDPRPSRRVDVRGEPEVHLDREVVEDRVDHDPEEPEAADDRDDHQAAPPLRRADLVGQVGHRVERLRRLRGGPESRRAAGQPGEEVERVDRDDRADGRRGVVGPPAAAFQRDRGDLPEESAGSAPRPARPARWAWRACRRAESGRRARPRPVRPRGHPAASRRPRRRQARRPGPARAGGRMAREGPGDRRGRPGGSRSGRCRRPTGLRDGPHRSAIAAGSTARGLAGPAGGGAPLARMTIQTWRFRARSSPSRTRRFGSQRTAPPTRNGPSVSITPAGRFRGAWKGRNSRRIFGPRALSATTRTTRVRLASSWRPRKPFEALIVEPAITSPRNRISQAAGMSSIQSVLTSASMTRSTGSPAMRKRTNVRVRMRPNPASAIPSARRTRSPKIHLPGE